MFLWNSVFVLVRACVMLYVIHPVQFSIFLMYILSCPCSLALRTTLAHVNSLISVDWMNRVMTSKPKSLPTSSTCNYRHNSSFPIQNSPIPPSEHWCWISIYWPAFQSLPKLKRFSPEALNSPFSPSLIHTVSNFKGFLKHSLPWLLTPYRLLSFFLSNLHRSSFCICNLAVYSILLFSLFHV